MHRLMWLGVLVAVVSLPLGRAVEAADLFEIFAESDDGQVEVRSGGSSVIDLLEDVIRNRNEFTDFAGRAFTADLTFAGVDNAMHFEFNEDETEVTVSFPITGFSRTFTGANRDELEDEIIDFLKKDGAREYAKFQREIEKRSLVAVLDGNPGSTTALLSRQSFQRYGLGPLGPMWFDRPRVRWGDDKGRNWWVSVAPSFERISADRFSGHRATFDLSAGFWFTDEVGLSVSGVTAYREIEGADTYQFGVDVGLPIRLRDRRSFGDTGFALGWQVTPFGTFGGGGSIDMASGGLIGGGGVTNQLHFGFDGFDIVAANQIAYYEGLRVRIDDYEFRPELSQYVLTNGLMAHIPLDQAEQFVIESGASYTRYLDDAAVQGWVSPTIGLSARTQRNHTFKISYTADLGEKSYRSHNFQFNMNIQF